MIKNTQPYMGHDSNHRLKEEILKMRMVHGWKGYGIYWAIKEILRDTVDYKRQCDYESLAFELQTEATIIKSLIEDFDIFQITGEFFSSIDLINKMELKDQKSVNNSNAAKTRWDKVRRQKEELKQQLEDELKKDKGEKQ